MLYKLLHPKKAESREKIKETFQTTLFTLCLERVAIFLSNTSTVLFLPTKLLNIYVNYFRG